jgi:hypothetical protein
MSAKYKSPSFLLPNELNTSANTANDTGINSLYSMNFDGSSQYINTGFTISSTSSYTLSAWFKTTTTNQDRIILGDFNSSAQNTSARAILGFNGTRIYLNMGDGTSQDNNYGSGYNASSYFDGNWHLYTLTINGFTQKAYLDGTLVETWTSSVSAGTAGERGYTIGRYGDFASTNYFNGQIDEVAIFNKALNTTEIAALYDGTGSNIRPSNLMASNLNPIAYYPLGEQAQNTGYLDPNSPGNDISGSEWQFPNGVLQDYVIDFDGSNQYINAGVISALSNVSEYSISLWANINTGASGTLRLFGNRESSSPYNGIGADINLSASLYFYLNGGPSYPVVQVSNISNYVTAGTWFNLVCTFNTGQAYVFIDGVQRGSGTGSSTADTTTNPLYIGADPINTGSYFDGQISNFVLWSSDQSANIANIYNNGSPQTIYTVTPQNWWKLNADSVYTPSAPNYTTALNFDGSNTEYIDTNFTGLNNASTATISAWMNIPVFTNLYALGNLQIDGGTYKGIGFNPSTSIAFVYVNNNTSGVAYFSFNPSNYYSAGNWFNIVFVFDGSESGTDRLKVYIDKNLVTGTWSGTPLNVLETSTSNFLIGNDGQLSAPYFTGQISNTAIYNTALTATQVSTLFNFGTPETAISFSPQAWWKLNDQTAITDYSGNGHTGTNNGATDIPSGVAVTPSWKIPDASGTSNGVSTTLPSTALQQSDLQFNSPFSNFSLSFDGTGDYIDCGTSLGNTLGSSVSNMTISLWYKNETGSNEGLFTIMSSITAQTTAPFAISYNTNSIYVWFGSTDYNYYSQTLDSNWHHLSIVKNGTSLTTYIDGSSVSPSGTSGSIPATIDTTNKKTFIGIYYSASFGYNGKIDETAIFNTALTSAQVLEIYNNGRPKDLTTFSGTAPISWWRLGENAYFDNNIFTVPNSISGAPNGVGSGTVTTMLSADAPGTYANGIGTNLDIIDRVGDASLSVANSQSYNMIPDDKVPYVPGYVGAQTTNAFEMTFDGVDDYIDANKTIQSNLDFSVSVWINPNASDLQILGTREEATGASSSKGFILQTNSSNQIRARLFTTTSTITEISGGTVSTGVWSQVAMTYVSSSKVLKIYVNGTEVGSVTGTVIPVVSPDNLNIGRAGVGGLYHYFNGKIDEVAIFDKALTADQIKFDLYSATTSGKTADIENNTNLPTPVAWYRMGD